MRYSVPYGKYHLIFNIPKDFEVSTVNSKLCKPVTNVSSKTKESILHPINSLPLSELVKGKKSACILVTDITRECPDEELLPPILETLETELNKEDISILIASGMHRKMTVDEKVSKYGKKINLIPIRIRITTKPVRGLRDRVGGDTFRVKIRENTRKIPKNI